MYERCIFKPADKRGYSVKVREPRRGLWQVPLAIEVVGWTSGNDSSGQQKTCTNTREQRATAATSQMYNIQTVNASNNNT